MFGILCCNLYEFFIFKGFRNRYASVIITVIRYSTIKPNKSLLLEYIENSLTALKR
jgi:hypothetical protein